MPPAKNSRGQDPLLGAEVGEFPMEPPDEGKFHLYPYFVPQESKVEGDPSLG